MEHPAAALPLPADSDGEEELWFDDSAPPPPTAPPGALLAQRLQRLAALRASRAALDAALSSSTPATPATAPAPAPALPAVCSPPGLPRLALQAASPALAAQPLASAADLLVHLCDAVFPLPSARAARRGRTLPLAALPPPHAPGALPLGALRCRRATHRRF
jgi:hypothetical protein